MANLGVHHENKSPEERVQEESLGLATFGPDGSGKGRDVAAPMPRVIERPEILEVRLDLAGVSYMDSSSLGILLLLHERAAAKGKRVVLAHPTASMRSELHVVQFERIFHIEE